jgi:hypothetical protein
VKKLLLALPVLFVLNGCVAPNTNTSTTPSTSQQLGVTALKVAVNAKCMSEINTLPAWKTATRLMTTEQRENIQMDVCGCVSEKAPNSVTTLELATAAIDPSGRMLQKWSVAGENGREKLNSLEYLLKELEAKESKKFI